MSHPLAHGRAELHAGSAEVESVLAYAFLNADGTLEVIAESPDGDADGDTRITFPASAIAENVAKRIRGRAK